MPVSLDQIKEEISNITIHNPMNEMRLNFLFMKRGRLIYFLRLIEAEEVLKNSLSDKEILELKLHLEKTQEAIDSHHLLSFKKHKKQESELQEMSYKELKQGLKNYKQSMNAFIRKNKRSNIGRLRLKYFFQ